VNLKQRPLRVSEVGALMQDNVHVTPEQLTFFMNFPLVYAGSGAQVAVCVFYAAFHFSRMFGCHGRRSQ
jgi:hypothetical protein